MKTTFLKLSLAITLLQGAAAIAHGQETVDFREAIRTAEPALFSVTAEPDNADVEEHRGKSRYRQRNAKQQAREPAGSSPFVVPVPLSEKLRLVQWGVVPEHC